MKIKFLSILTIVLGLRAAYKFIQMFPGLIFLSDQQSDFFHNFVWNLGKVNDLAEKVAKLDFQDQSKAAEKVRSNMKTKWELFLENTDEGEVSNF